MNAYKKIILGIDPTADVERVLDIEDAKHRYFGEMSKAQWRACVQESKK